MPTPGMDRFNVALDPPCVQGSEGKVVLWVSKDWGGDVSVFLREGEGRILLSTFTVGPTPQRIELAGVWPEVRADELEMASLEFVITKGTNVTRCWMPVHFCDEVIAGKEL